tara:strand:- start:3293 stop:4042 length:750 start_codon:yes stop_codon:yes gene_type:complete
MSERTTVILTNWKRPGNLSKIIDAFQSQTVMPAAMLLVDNHPEEEPEFAFVDTENFADVYRFETNAGPCCRFAGASFVTTEFVLFFDDDLMPGKGAIEAYQDQADRLNGEFATLSDVGRIYRGNAEKGYSIRRRNCRRKTDGPAKVDMTCRAHLVRSEYVSVAVRDRIRAAKDGATPSMLRHDDIFLSQGIQLETGWASYLARDVGHDAKLRHKDLPAPHSGNGLPNHDGSRNELVNWYAEKGWGSKWR